MAGAGRFGICTLPPHVVAELESDFDAGVTFALREPQTVTTGKIGLEYDRRFWETDEGIYGGVTACDPSIRYIWYPSTGYLGDGGVLVGAYPFGPPADRFSRLTHDERLELALTAGAAVHGDVYRDEVRSSFSVDWLTQPHSLGAWSLWANLDVGYKRLQQSAGRWWFAGDWLTRTPGCSTARSSRRAGRSRRCISRFCAADGSESAARRHGGLAVDSASAASTAVRQLGGRSMPGQSSPVSIQYERIDEVPSLRTSSIM